MTRYNESDDGTESVQGQLNWLRDKVLKLETAMRENRGASKSDNADMPPLPDKQGRKLLGRKRDVRVRIDEALYDLLSEQANSEFGGNMSAALDMVLWNFYGQPRLSFQDDEADPT